jgi:hypothetical protein
VDAYPHAPSRSQDWVRLQDCLRHTELLQPAAATPRSIFFTGVLLRANGEPC